MADEIVGSVRVDVHGNTEPLKDDVRRAAHQIKHTIDAEVNSGTGTNITDNIVDQVNAAEKPAEQEAKKVGRAISKGVDVGSKDVDTKSRIVADLKDAEAPLRAMASRLGRALGISTGTAMADAHKEATAKIRADTKVEIEVDREKFRADLTGTQKDWFDFSTSLNRSLETAFMPWWKARAALREDAKVKIEMDRERFRSSLKDSQKDWFDFGSSLRKSFDADMKPWWKRLFHEDTGAVAIGGVVGRDVGRKLIDGVRRGMASGFGGGGGGGGGGGKNILTDGLGKLLSAGAPLVMQGAMYGFGIRVAAVVGGGLLSGLTTIGQGLAGWASSIVGQVGQAVVGVGAVVAGTVGSAFAGLGATAYSSIAAIAPALIGLKAGFSGMEKEEKKAFEDRLKKATENVKVFGRAFRGEFMEPLFAGLKRLDALGPTLENFGSSLGKAASGLFTDFTKMLTSGPMIKQINTFLQSSVGYLTQVGGAAMGLAPAVLGAFNAISPVTEKFFTDISGGLESVTKWITQVSEGGKNSKLTTTLDEWYERGKRLLGVFKTVAGAVVKIFDAAVEARGDAFLDSLSNVATKFSSFIRIASSNGSLEKKLGVWYDQGANLASAFGNLSKIVLLFFDTAGEAGGNALGDFKATTDRWLDTFRIFRSSGQLKDLISGWYDQGKQMLDILGNVGRTVGHIIGVAAGNSDGFLASFEKMTAGWERWTTSFQGSQTLTEYFAGSESVLGEVVGLLGDLAKLFGPTFTAPADNLKNLFQTMREVWVPAIGDLLGSLRDSNLQESLFKVIESLTSLNAAGVIGTTFDAIATALGVIAEALKLMGPFVPAFVSFVVAMKTFSMLKLASNATGLTALAKGIKAIADARVAAAAAEGLGAAAGAAKAGTVAAETVAAGAVEGAVAGEVAGTTAGTVAAGRAGKVGKAASKVIKKAGTAALTAIGLEAVPLTAAALAPLAAAAAVAAGIAITIKHDNDKAKEAVHFAVSDSSKSVDEMLDTYHKLRGGIKASFAKSAEKNDLTFLTEGMDTFQTSIESLAKSGDFDTAFKKLKDLQDLLAESGGDPKVAEDLNTIEASIRDVHIENLTGQISELAASGDWEEATDKAGKFLATLAAEGVDTATLEKIRKWTIDLLTATAEGDVVETSGTIDPAARAKAIEDLRQSPGMWEKGDWTKAGKEAKQALIDGFTTVSFGPTLQTNLAEIPKTLANFDPFKGAGGQWTKKGLRLRAEVIAEADWTSINGVKNALPKDGTEYKQIIDIVKDPKQWDPATGELKLGAKERIIDLQITGVEKAKKKIKELLGTSKDTWKDRRDDILKNTAPGVEQARLLREAFTKWQKDKKNIEAGGITTETTITSKLDESTLNSVIDTIENTPANLTIDPDLKNLKNPKIQAELDAYYKEHPLTVSVTAEVVYPDHPSYTTGDNGPSGTPSGGYPSGRPRLVTPSMISPGGPTTMGFADSITPFASGRANLTTGPGVLGSPNRWSNQDKDKDNKNVTINNYYPKPERTSDSLAMQMRLARFA